jgi:hypothetical protein
MLERFLQELYQKINYFKLMCARIQESVQVVEHLENANVQVVKKENNLIIWHKKLGHLSEQNQNLLV